MISALSDMFGQAAPMLFPMYTVASALLLRMTKIQPHEELKAKGLSEQLKTLRLGY